MCCEPYLESEYGQDYISESPVKLLDRLLYGHREHIDEEVSPTTLPSMVHYFKASHDHLIYHLVLPNA